MLRISTLSVGLLAANDARARQTELSAAGFALVGDGGCQPDPCWVHVSSAPQTTACGEAPGLLAVCCPDIGLCRLFCELLLNVGQRRFYHLHQTAWPVRRH